MMKRNKYFNSTVYACGECYRILGNGQYCPVCKKIAVEFDSRKEYDACMDFKIMMNMGTKRNGKTIVQVIHHKRFDLHPAIYVSREIFPKTRGLFFTIPDGELCYRILEQSEMEQIRFSFKKKVGFNLLYPSKYYEADIVLIFSDGSQEVIDIKPFSKKENKFLVLPEAKRKARMMKAVHGIDVVYM